MLRLLVVLLCCASCTKKTSDAPAQSERVAKPRAAEAEVEFVGTWSLGPVKDVAVTFVAQRAPCLPVPEKPGDLGTQKLTTEGKLFAEFFIAQGTVGHICLYGRDAEGRVVAAASSPKNPLTFQGDGEVVFTKLNFALVPLSP